MAGIITLLIIIVITITHITALHITPVGMVAFIVLGDTEVFITLGTATEIIMVEDMDTEDHIDPTTIMAMLTIEEMPEIIA